MRGLARFIMGGRVNAIFIAGFFGSMSLYFLPLAIFSGATLGLVQLRKGESESIQVALIAGLLIVITLLISPSRPGFPFPVVFALWLTVSFAVWVLRVTMSQTLVLLSVGLICSLFIVAMHLAVGDVVAWWREWLIITQPPGGEVKIDKFGEDEWTRLTNGLMAMFVGFATMFTVLFARWMQSVLYNPGGFANEFIRLRLPRLLLSLLVLVLLAASAINQEVIAEFFMVAMMVYFFQGVAVMHGVSVAKRLHQGWVMAPYLGLFFFPIVIIPGLALLGAIDTFINFRNLE